MIEQLRLRVKEDFMEGNGFVMLARVFVFLGLP